ncbi:hypothetical protein [Bradyrhizobium sp. STM 3562]|uniref:hypothetical protein n=1 Tax=Bradyrhizobium sp. STM 3562 TaxID=578924 RepID=UPI00388EAD00
MQLAGDRKYYGPTLLLVLAICLMDLSLSLYVTTVQPGNAGGSIERIGIGIAVLFGIWVQSTLARYIGGVWFLALGAALGWPVLINFGKGSLLGTGFVILACLLCLTCSWILLLSKGFAKEFGYLRGMQPAYKKILRQLATAGLTIAAAIGVAVDIYHLCLLPR